MQASGFFFGAFSFPIYSLCAAHVNDCILEEEVVSVASTLVLIYSIGSMAAPMLGSFVIQYAGPLSVFSLLSLLHFLFLLFGLYWWKRRLSVVDEVKESFLPIAATTSSAVQLDERSNDTILTEIPASEG